MERGFALEEPDGTLRTLPEVWSSSSIRMNEGGCDPDGRFEAEEAWRILDPVLDAWRQDLVPLEDYPAGSSGVS